jgi:dTDP-4-amino-4,6-dideoxygalactose transaminase
MKKRHIAIAELKISPLGRRYVNEALRSNRLSYGPYTRQFEREFARETQRKFAIVTNSGTSGLQVALHALKDQYKWKDGDEVLVPAITFIASSNVIIQNNLRPIFVDVEPDNYCINPHELEKKITSRTKAIMPVHLFGQSADMNPLIRIATKYNLKIIEDSCETMFVDYAKKPVGSLGHVAVYSTYIAHIMVTGVGGIVTTNDKELATRMKSLMFHGRDNLYLSIDDDDTTNRQKLNNLIERRFNFIHVGYSYRITELEGALGLAEMKRKSDIVTNRKRVGKSLTKALGEFDRYFQLPQEREKNQHIYMLYPIVIKDTRIKRDDFLLHLETQGIETRLFFPLLGQPIYKKLFGNIENDYPVAKRLVKNGFIIGSHPYLTQKDIQYVRHAFFTYLKKNNILEE